MVAICEVHSGLKPVPHKGIFSLVPILMNTSTFMPIGPFNKDLQHRWETVHTYLKYCKLI